MGPPDGNTDGSDHGGGGDWGAAPGGIGGDTQTGPGAGGGDGGTSGEAGDGGTSGEAGDGGTSGEGNCLPPHGGRDIIGNIRVPSDYPTIQAAIDASQDGDVVSVAAGLYVENIDFGGKAIRLGSESGPEVTVIDGNHQGPVVTFDSDEDSNSILQGFTIRHGSYSFGAGIRLSFASPTIWGNTFVDNEQGAGGFGAAIGGNNASPIVDSNTFRNNTCDSQFSAGVVSFVNESSPRIVNNVFLDNPCRGINLSLPEGNTPDVSNNTLIGNATGIYVTGWIPNQTDLFRNNIIINGTIGFEVELGGAQNYLPTWTHNLVYGNVTNFVGLDDPTGTSGNLSVDPLLVNAGAGDFHLQASSPAIDSGTATGPLLPALDIDGVARVVDGDGHGSEIVDLGASEFFADGDCGG